MTESSSTVPPRIPPRIPRWLWVVWGLAALMVVLFATFDVMRDPGVSNLLLIATVNSTLLVTLAWFVFGRGRRSRRLRVGVAVAVLGVLALVFTFFRVESVTGALIPTFEPRFAASPWDGLEPPTGQVRDVDLRASSRYDFPGFLGPGRDLLVSGIELETDLEAHPPELLWRQPIGKGWAGFAVVNGYAATLEQRDERELLTLYEVDTGRLVWAFEIGTRPYENLVAGAGPRSTPFIADGLVYAMGVYGRLVAVDARGELVWEVDLRELYGLTPEQNTEALPYGRPGSPLVVGDRVVVPAGGSEGGRIASAAAFDRTTGELLWDAGDHQIGMASPTLGTLGGVRQVLMVNQDWVTGHDLETGNVLWELPWPGKSGGDANVSNAVPVPPDRVFVSKGYGEGARLYRLERRAEGFEPVEIWRSARVLRTKFTNVAMKDGYVYGLSEGVLECVELDTGERAWKHGRYGHGQILLVGDVLLVLTEDGEVVLVHATPEERDQVFGRFQAIEGQTWNNFALAGDRLLVRNGREAAVFRMAIAGRSGAQTETGSGG